MRSFGFKVLGLLSYFLLAVFNYVGARKLYFNNGEDSGNMDNGKLLLKPVVIFLKEKNITTF